MASKYRTAKDWQGMNWIRREKRLALVIRDGFVCQYCGRDLRNAKPGDVALDHLIPRSQGGGNEAENLITVCSLDNSRRGDRDWRDYAPAGSQERIERTIQQPLNVELAKSLIAGRGHETEAAR